MIVYNGPVEEPVENPGEEFIKNIFFEKEADYWKQGSGDSCFEVEGEDEWLIFFYDEPYGFFIMRHPDYLVPLNEDVEIETIEHLVGGEPMKVPSCSYVSREEAYRIVQHFLSTKTMPDFVDWVDLYDIDFEHDF
ncbi:hypothetical protein [Bacillus sp. WP8]|uniref:hypothetical protein n=1 Tax=Bacillus sp. WP8 TaxID=756828 RepID=UPI0011A90F04|nr:hypothetical protein [Bacillus sp. WP8]